MCICFEFLLSVSLFSKVFLRMFYKFSYNLEFPRRDGISIFAKLFEREGFVRFLEFELFLRRLLVLLVWLDVIPA